MSEELKFYLSPNFNDRGDLGKYHLSERGTKRTLCSPWIRPRYNSARPLGIEGAVRLMNLKQKRHRHACKRCIKMAEKLRCPLQRMSEI